MLRCARVLALPLGLLLAAGIGACGSNDGTESGATAVQPPLTAARSTTAPATSTATTVATSTVATTVPPATTQTTPATTPTSTQPTGGATTTQPSGGAPGGCPNAVGGFIRDVRATDCGAARSVAAAWFGAVHDGAAPDGPIEAAGYSCTATLAGERASVTCAGAGGSVAFTASP